ncbi:diguanylate cyclase [Qipengyuania sp. MTN3-11]|uniref:sensor domain-containing diguanylate cyclase n=1 Tax=Qipengyuania sp. MTN3-11 TaxID=3056557 RepID=UPI0036F33B92
MGFLRLVHVIVVAVVLVLAGAAGARAAEAGTQICNGDTARVEAGFSLAPPPHCIEGPERSEAFPDTRQPLPASEGGSTRQTDLRALVYALICGLLIVPLIYDMLFYRVLRARFMLWHLAMIAAMLAFVLTSSGLINLLYPQLSSQARWHFAIASLSATVTAAMAFALGSIEDRIIPRWLARTVLATTGTVLLVNLLGLFGVWPIRQNFAVWYFSSLFAVAVAALALVATGLARHSRAATYLAIGFSGMAVTALLAPMVRTGAIAGTFPLDDVLYAALVILALGTSAGVGDRVLNLRSQRDRARDKAVMLGRMANTDGLTGLLNRRAFDQLSRLRPGKGLLLGDLDRFKQINDAHGHQTGDAVLCHAATLLREAMADRPHARVYRLGGEEFAIMARIEDRAELETIAEDLRAAIAEHSGSGGSGALPPITISLGGVVGTGQPIREAIATADGALYRAKQEGRNRIAIAEVETGDDTRARNAPSLPEGA